jgi:hypothetical protein
MKITEMATHVIPGREDRNRFSSSALSAQNQVYNKFRLLITGMFQVSDDNSIIGSRTAVMYGKWFWIPGRGGLGTIDSSPFHGMFTPWHRVNGNSYRSKLYRPSCLQYVSVAPSLSLSLITPARFHEPSAEGPPSLPTLPFFPLRLTRADGECARSREIILL